jgi:hypothetical protein
MNLTQISSVLEKLYNTLGNKYLTTNFITEPFEFEVKIRYGNEQDYYDYIIEVYSNPPMPDSLQYRPEIKKQQNKKADGVHISVIIGEFKKIFDYVDINNKRHIGVNFMNRSYK